jgi:hypothetical protein
VLTALTALMLAALAALAALLAALVRIAHDRSCLKVRSPTRVNGLGVERVPIVSLPCYRVSRGAIWVPQTRFTSPRRGPGGERSAPKGAG